MAKSTILDLIGKRFYSELESVAASFIEERGWNAFIDEVVQGGWYGFEGKDRDAIVHLLQLESVGGTDTDIREEFGKLSGSSLDEVRQNALDHAITLLKDQIENHHTYFIDVEAMAATPFAILVEDVLSARKRELEQLEQGASRIDVLGTYYGFTILMAEGARPQGMSSTPSTGGYYGYRRYRRKRTWLDEEINEEAAAAIRNITGEFASAIDMDRAYKTLGSSKVFKKRCQKPTANILENAVRLSLYKAPMHRRQGANALGRMEDSRALPFLHRRMLTETNTKTSVAIAQAMGRIGHPSSPHVIMRSLASETRYRKALVEKVTPLGDIYGPESREVLLILMKHRISAVRAEAIACFARHAPPDLVEIIAPNLNESSKPIVRQSVLALSKAGQSGVNALSAQMEHILKVIGNDRPSARAMEALLAVESIGEREDVHEHFAKKLKKETSYLARWVKQKETSSYHYYQIRYIRRGLRQLEGTLRVAGKYLAKPYKGNLTTELREAKRIVKTARGF